jgi:hypothetical protein
VDPPNAAEWTTAIGTVVVALGTLVTAGGVIFLWKQIGLLREQGDLLTKQITADHDRSRRENAINYLFEWSRGLLQANSLARKLVEGLNETQTLDLAKEKPLRLGTEKRDLVSGVLSKIPEGGLKEQGGEILLGEREVSDIRWQVVRYLNNLESIFAAARHNVADRGILIEQFGFLVSPREGHHLLRKFRDALGGAEAYPGLHELEEELERKYKAREEGKPPADRVVQTGR